jgi:hypothetical protein
MMEAMVSLALMNVTGYKNAVFLLGKFPVNKSMKSASLQENLMSVHHENAPEDSIFFLLEGN